MASQDGQSGKILFEKIDQTAVITINNPERKNAFDHVMDRELARHLGECDLDDSTRAVVITGAGNIFSSGADLEGEDGLSLDEGLIQKERKDFPEPWRVRKPVIGALNGHAIGGGLAMAMTYDMRIACSDSKYALNFVQRGMSSEYQMAWILSRLVGAAPTLDLLMTGRTILGSEAARLGLVNEAVAQDQVLERALEIARDIAEKCTPVSVAVSKRLTWASMGMHEIDEYSKIEDRANRQLNFSKDCEEAVMAFLERRSGNWTESPVNDYPDIPL